MGLDRASMPFRRFGVKRTSYRQQMSPNLPPVPVADVSVVDSHTVRQPNSREERALFGPGRA